jgi:hypothetical protein
VPAGGSSGTASLGLKLFRLAKASMSVPSTLKFFLPVEDDPGPCPR